MKVAIVVTFTNGFGAKGQYHSQEIGMAKQFAAAGHEVVLYKALQKGLAESTEHPAPGVTMHWVSVRSFGAQGLMDPAIFPTDLDALIYFSDTQIALNKIYAWAKKHHVAFFPYVGITSSRSQNPALRKAMDLLYRVRTLPVYRRHGAVAKTEAMKEELEAQGVTRVLVAPVGIDLDALHQGESDSALRHELRTSLGLGDDSKLVLYVGKLEHQKSPSNAIDLLAALPPTHHLLMIGKGVLHDELVELAERLNVAERVHWVESVPNSEMYRYYQAADVFVNVNHEEIFGMAVIEAVYYQCQTLALTAPGPDFILANMEAHRLFGSMDEMATYLARAQEPTSTQLEADRKLLLERCSWQTMVDVVEHEVELGEW